MTAATVPSSRLRCSRDGQVQEDVGKPLAPPGAAVLALAEQEGPRFAGVGILVAWALIGEFEGQDLAQVIDQFVAELRIGLPADGVVELTFRPACRLAGQAPAVSGRAGFAAWTGRGGRRSSGTAAGRRRGGHAPT